MLMKTFTCMECEPPWKLSFNISGKIKELYLVGDQWHGTSHFQDTDKMPAKCTFNSSIYVEQTEMILICSFLLEIQILVFLYFVLISNQTKLYGYLNNYWLYQLNCNWWIFWLKCFKYMIVSIIFKKKHSWMFDWQLWTKKEWKKNSIIQWKKEINLIKISSFIYGMRDWSGEKFK